MDTCSSFAPSPSSRAASIAGSLYCSSARLSASRCESMRRRCGICARCKFPYDLLIVPSPNSCGPIACFPDFPMGLLFCVSVFTLSNVFRAAASRTNHSPPHSAQLRVPSRLLASLKCRSPRPLSAGLSRPFCCGPEGADRCASRPLLPHVASCSCPRASRLTRPCLLAAKSFDHTESLKLSSLRGHPAPGCSTTVHRAPSRSTRTRAFRHLHPGVRGAARAAASHQGSVGPRGGAADTGFAGNVPG